MNYIKLIIGIIICLLVSSCDNSLKKTEITQLEKYVKEYVPEYVFNGDTLAVSRIKRPTEITNNYLLESVKNRQYDSLYCCIAVIHKQYKEYYTISKQDYPLEALVYGVYSPEHHGVVALIYRFLEDNNVSTRKLFLGEAIIHLHLLKHKIPNYNEIYTLSSVKVEDNRIVW